MKSLIVKIPQPCHERWDAMQPAEQGRFCASCRKTVVDYTALSDRELVQRLNQSATTCGRFRNDQLNRPLVMADQRTNPGWQRWLGVLTMGLLGWQTAQAQGNQPVPQQSHKSARLDRPNDSQPLQVAHNSDPVMLITGTVSTTAATGKLEAVPGATLHFKGTGVGTNTDGAGAFRLTIPAELQGKSITLVVGFIGLVTQEIALNPSVQTVQVKLIEDTNVLGGEVVVVNYRSSRWQRLKSKLFRKSGER